MPRLTATAEDLAPEVAAALATPRPGSPADIDVEGTTWPALTWGDDGDPPLLLAHGVTSNAQVWWRVGPALAAAGRRVVAIDMPGHGRSPLRKVSHRFVDTATLLAGLIRAAALDQRELVVIGHSWGGIVTAHLPLAGVRPAGLILLDPPVLKLAELQQLAHDSTEREYATLAEATSAVRAAYPSWSDGDVAAKAQALTEFAPQLVLDVLLRNGDLDGGMAALRDPRGAGIPVWLIRGEWELGGLIPDSKVPEIERQLGADRVITITGGPHSPQRTQPEATVLAILRAIGAA